MKEEIYRKKFESKRSKSLFYNWKREEDFKKKVKPTAINEYIRVSRDKKTTNRRTDYIFKYKGSLINVELKSLFSEFKYERNIKYEVSRIDVAFITRRLQESLLQAIEYHELRGTDDFILIIDTELHREVFGYDKIEEEIRMNKALMEAMRLLDSKYLLDRIIITYRKGEWNDIQNKTFGEQLQIYKERVLNRPSILKRVIRLFNTN